jgi:hypothetical protein
MSFKRGARIVATFYNLSVIRFYYCSVWSIYATPFWRNEDDTLLMALYFGYQVVKTSALSFYSP